MVVAERGEDGAVEVDRGDPALVDRVRGHLHEAVTAAGPDHRGEHVLELDRVRRGVRVGAVVAADEDPGGGYQPAPVAEHGEEFVQQRRDGGLAVRAGDADDDQRSRWTAVDLCRKVGERIRRIVDAKVRDAAGSQERRDLARQFLRADDGGASSAYGVGHERMSICSRPRAGDEERAGSGRM